MNNFKIIDTFTSRVLTSLNTFANLNRIRDGGIVASTARNTSRAGTIKLTFTEPDYTFAQAGLYNLLIGMLYPTIEDYTGGTVEGNLRLPFKDTPGDALGLIRQFRLMQSAPTTVVYLDRKTSGGQTVVNFGTFASSSNYVKISRVSSGVQTNDTAEIQLWTDGDDGTTGFYIFITALSFTSGSEQVRLIATQAPPPLSLPECCRYSPTATFDNLDFIQTLHPEYSLNAWCYFGRLQGNSNVYAVTMLIQKNIPFRIPGVHHKFSFDIAGGFNTETLSKWQIDGCASSTGPVTKSDPWSVSDTCNDGAVPADLTTVSAQLTSGYPGLAGAEYKLLLEAIISDDFHINPVYIEINVTDLLGTVREGFGPDAFLPNWLTTEQRNAVLNTYGGSVENYLAAGVDDLECQGSYYFSQPLLSVDSFTIFDLEGNVLDTKAPGDDSVIWFDYVAQSFNEAGLEILADVGWQFFAIQFPTEKKAIMVTRITTQTSGVYTLANLFTETGVTRWNIDDIQIVGSYEWTSPSGAQYYTTHDITLTNPSATITVQSEWDNQEISVGGETKYEGICTVTATVLGTPMTGFAWIEQQAISSP